MCVLRVSGLELDPYEFLASSSLEPAAVFVRGRPRLASRPDGPMHEESGINWDVSDASWDQLPSQVEDAIAFLKLNRAEIERLVTHRGVTAVGLDFAVSRAVGGSAPRSQSVSFPAELLRLAGELGLDVSVSTYFVDESDEERGGGLAN